MRARAGFAPDRRLVAALFGTLKLTQMYGRRHSTTTDALLNLAEAVRAAVEDGEAKISVRGTRLQVNDRTMRASECGALALSFLAEEWSKREIEHVRIAPTVEPADLGAFAEAFVELDLTRPEPFERLREAYSNAGCKGVFIERREESYRDPVLLEERRESAMRSYLRGLRAFKDVLRMEGFQDRSKRRRARRAIQSLVENFLEDETAVLALAQIAGHDPRLFHHSLNVCIYALLIGQRLGMTRRQLGELGLAALFHDVGKTVRGKGDEEETQWDALRRHPGRGARLLLEEGTAHEAMLKAAIASYEHHVHYDQSGFPDIDYRPHLVSRIVALADCYEALTSQRDYRESPYSPYDALSLMRAKAGAIFDPLLLKVFVNAVGAYPVGSLVELSSGEVAIVVEGPGGTNQFDRPKVRVVQGCEGGPDAGSVIDLAEGAATIVRAVPSNEVFDDVSAFVAAI